MIISAILTLAFGIAEETNWAVLVAGSKSWENYRHQADVCHAFQVLHQIGGIPKENIIVMMYDDIAFNDVNPYLGNIINTPYGRNVYPGVPKDYTGGEANKERLRTVLLGGSPPKSLQNSKHSGKVLNSTKDDNVFIYFSDHGAKGLVEMPNGDPLWADELLDILTEMKQLGKFKNLIFYLEACQSGSMFENLLHGGMNVYAMTSTSPDEPSFAYYWDEERKTWLADKFSVSWIADSEANMTAPFETIKQQFEITQSRTESSVQEYGDFFLNTEEVGEFQGIENEIRTNPVKEFIYEGRGTPQWDARLEGLKRTLSAEKQIAVRMQIQRKIDREILDRHQTQYMFKIIVGYTVPEYSDYNNTLAYWKNVNLQPHNFTALRLVWKYASHKCVNWNAYALQFWSVLVSLYETFGYAILARGMKMACD